MAKYQQYEQYKESGVEWLGDIPSYWEINRHKYVASFTKGKNPQEIFDEYSPDYYPYLSMDSLRGNSAHKYAPLAKNLYLVNENQPLIIWDGSNAGEFVRGRRGILSSTMAAAKLNCMMNPNYYWYLCMCIEPEMRKHANGMGIPHVNGDELKNISLVNPSLSEQSKIANFLDHETAQIDTLIEKQQTLIQLLKEKRQAVISHAVTKGLNPDAPMKDSGVEWLGGIPSNWSVGALKYWADIIDCKHITAEFVEDGYPLASISEVKEWTVNLSTSKFTTKKYYLELIENGRKPVIGDILYSRNATVGEAALVIDDMPDFAMGQDICLIRSNDKILSEYIMYVLNSGIIKKQLDLAMVGSIVSSK